MKELKKKRITIELTDEEYTNLLMKTNVRRTTVNKLLSQFIADLTYSDRMNGQENYQLLSDWFSRNF